MRKYILNGVMCKFLKAGLVGLALVLTVPAAGQDPQKAGEAYKRGDYATALREWRPLAEAGDSVAQAALGFMYYDGEGVPQNFAQAYMWFLLAAEQGNVHAQTVLGVMYAEDGLGVSQDYAEAVKWYRLAAEQGYARAQSNLGVMYAKGRGVPQNYVQAHMWFNLAAAQGNEDAAKNRDIVARTMTPADISKAQQMAREWLEKHK